VFAFVRELVLENPRPYNVVTYYTVHTGCDDCKKVQGEFVGVSYSYDKVESKLDTPTFFGVLYYTSDPKVREVFHEHNFKTVPYLGTSVSQTKRETTEGFYRDQDIWLIKRDDAHDTQTLLNFVNKRLNRDVPIKFPFYVVLLRNLMLFTVLATLIVVFVKIRPFLIEPWLWVSIAWVTYVICLSGVVFTMLHNMPVFRFDQDQFGKMFVKEYFMRSQRSQYAGEGYIVSVLSVCIGFGFLFLSKVDLLFKNDMNRRIAIMAAIIFCFAGTQAYVSIYRIKQPWYSNSFMPPQGFTRGPIMRD